MPAPGAEDDVSRGDRVRRAGDDLSSGDEGPGAPAREFSGDGDARPAEVSRGADAPAAADHFRFIFERAEDAIVVSRNGIHVLVNEALCRLFACDSAADLIGNPILDLIAPEERTRVRQINRAREQGQPAPSRYETKGLKSDGTIFDMEVRVSGYELNGVRYTLVSLNDISERVQAAEQRRKANEMLRALVQASPVAIVAFDNQGRTTLWNSTAEKLFGWSEQEVLGRPLPFVPAESADENATIRSLAIGGIGLSNVELQRVRKDGSMVDVAVSTAPVRDGGGAVIGVMAVYVDITERRRMEQRLADAQKMEAVGRLAGGIAHDFNNLLTIISGYTQMLLDTSPEDDPDREPTQEILLAAQRAARLTNQLLAFSRRQVLQMQPVALAEQVTSMENLLRRAIGEHIDLRTRIAPEIPLVSANPGQIEQVIMNLALNARDAMPGGGTLTIEVGGAHSPDVQAWEAGPVEPGLYAMLAVHDTGHGMDADTRTRIFEPFFTTREAGKGTGLGLATVYGIVKQHRGYIGVASGPGEGTVFRVYLPAVREVGPAAVAEDMTAPARGHETVLVVEDESSLKRLVSGMLRAEGYNVIDADTVAEATRLASTHDGPIHLLLSDVVMPEMGGPELARKLTAVRPGLKVAFMSGYMDNAVSREILADHGRFLEKPFTKAALLRLVREALDRSGG
jgi:PAS domain S-box-containing protein